MRQRETDRGETERQTEERQRETGRGEIERYRVETERKTGDERETWTQRHSNERVKPREEEQEAETCVAFLPLDRKSVV